MKVWTPGSHLNVCNDVSGVVRFVRVGPAMDVWYMLAWMHEGKMVEEWFPEGEIVSPAQASLGHYTIERASKDEIELVGGVVK
mgnify:CR=1 FL=1